MYNYAFMRGAVCLGILLVACVVVIVLFCVVFVIFVLRCRQSSDGERARLFVEVHRRGHLSRARGHTN